MSTTAFHIISLENYIKFYCSSVATTKGDQTTEMFIFFQQTICYIIHNL